MTTRLRKRLAQVAKLTGERPELWAVLAGVADAFDELRKRVDRLERELRDLRRG